MDGTSSGHREIHCPGHPGLLLAPDDGGEQKRKETEMKTKSDEISILKEAVARLGQNSYCGPWLRDIIGQIEMEIRSDYPPSPSLVQAERDCNILRELTRAETHQMLASAQSQAKKILADAECSVRDLRERAAVMLREMSLKLAR